MRSATSRGLHQRQSNYPFIERNRLATRIWYGHVSSAVRIHRDTKRIASAFPEVVTSGAKNVVLVHGAYVDGSSWRQVHDQLWLKGYKVTVVRQSQTTFDDNVAAARAAIDAQDGPVVLVGHDSGGAVISVAGPNEKVRALVYVAALLPAVGESVSQLTASRPLAQDALLPTGDGRHVIDAARFSQVFAADLPPNRTNFMSIAQPGVSRAALDAKASACIRAHPDTRRYKPPLLVTHAGYTRNAFLMCGLIRQVERRDQAGRLFKTHNQLENKYE